MHTFDLTHSDIYEAARVLVDAGAPDSSWRALRGSMVCLSGPSLHWIATRAVRENVNQGPLEVFYAPWTGSPPSPSSILNETAKAAAKAAKEIA